MPEPEDSKPKNYFHGITPETRRKQREKATATAKIRAQERKDGLRLPRGEDPVTCDVSYTDDETEFLLAIEKYKKYKKNMKRRFPTYREILNVLKSLGYRKT